MKFSAFTVAAAALTINVGAYTTEIIRAGFDAIPRGQIEAAEGLALSRAQIYWHVVMLPAIEKVYPALTSQFVLLMLASSVTSQISAEELTAVANYVQSDTYRAFETYILVAHRLHRPVAGHAGRVLASRPRDLPASSTPRHPFVRRKMGGSLNVNHLMFLGYGALWTIGLSLIGLLGGGIAGFIIALCRISPSRIVRLLSAGYVQLIQGTPLLVIMFLTYFGLPALGLTVSPLMAAGASLTIYVSAYLGEIWRGCIESVPKPQWEAAEGLALSRSQRMMKVILPQAVRIATPPTVGFMVQIIKNTSLASVVGFVELARSGQIINNSLFEPFLIYTIIAVDLFRPLLSALARSAAGLETRERPGPHRT